MVIWSKPPIGWIKLNVDGFCRGNPRPCGGGVALQDAQGIFRAIFSKKFHDCTNNGVELKALLIGVKLCKQLGFQHAITETNSKLVVEWITKQSCSAWYLWDYWDGLQVKFQEIEFTINHTFREGNQIVDFLSKKGSAA